MKISYCIGTHNEEPRYIQGLLDQLLKHIDPEDEIIVVDDFSDNQETLNALSAYEDRINFSQHALGGDFSTHKNYKKGLAKSDSSYIVDIDADENVNEFLLKALKEILLANPTVEAYHVPRINIVPDITDEDMRMYGWSFYPGTNYINLPDYQTRIYKNKPEIKWVNKVHEILTGYTTHTSLPFLDGEGKVDPSYCLLHVKDISRQRAQNQFYSTI